MQFVTFVDVIHQAANTQKTVAQNWGLEKLTTLFESILDSQVAGFCLDSRKVQEGCIFVLLNSLGLDKKTAIANANRYLQSIDVNCVIISEFSEQEIQTANLNNKIVFVPQIRQILGDLIAARLQLQKAVKLPKVVAVTGTNGKTTVSQLIAQLCQLSGRQAAIMGTAGNGRLDRLVESKNTTGDVLTVHEFLYEMACQGVQVVALEASSHGLDQYRLQGVPVQVAVYTNLSHDHLDYHADMQAYRDAKARLFDEQHFPTLKAAIINADAHPLFDTWSQSYPCIKYSQLKSWADYFAKNVAPSLQGVEISIQTPKQQLDVNSPLLGLFNVDNLLASIAAFNQLFDEQANLPDWISKLQGARGRMQKAQSNSGCFIVDYAHTPDALVQVLSSLRKHCTGRLIAVFGCGGDRDKTKRPLMTRAGIDYADDVILTSDNPRSENPNAILSDMQAGLSCQEHYKIQIQPDRKLAINLAVQMARADDVVVIAGKGHETYQEIQGVRYDFDDLKVLQDCLLKLKK